MDEDESTDVARPEDAVNDDEEGEGELEYPLSASAVAQASATASARLAHDMTKGRSALSELPATSSGTEFAGPGESPGKEASTVVRTYHGHVCDEGSISPADPAEGSVGLSADELPQRASEAGHHARDGRPPRMSDLSMLSIATSDGSENSSIEDTTTGPAVVAALLDTSEGVHVSLANLPGHPPAIHAPAGDAMAPTLRERTRAHLRRDGSFGRDCPRENIVLAGDG